MALAERIPVGNHTTPDNCNPPGANTKVAIFGKGAIRRIAMQDPLPRPNDDLRLKNRLRPTKDFGEVWVNLVDNNRKWPRPNFDIVCRRLPSIKQFARVSLRNTNPEACHAMVLSAKVGAKSSLLALDLATLTAQLPRNGLFGLTALYHLSLSGNGVSFSHGLSGLACIFHRFAREHDLPQQQGRTDYADPNAPLCPKCAIFGGIGRAPLSAKIAFALPFWLAAWGAILEGLGVGLSRKRRLSLSWLVGGMAVGLIPFLLGIV